MQLIGAGREVVATSHTADKLKERLASRSMQGSGSLHLESSIDITDKAALMRPELWTGVTQVVTTVGPAFGRQPDGSMGSVSMTHGVQHQPRDQCDSACSFDRAFSSLQICPRKLRFNFHFAMCYSSSAKAAHLAPSTLSTRHCISAHCSAC